MPRPEFRKSAVRRRPSPTVESLEGRALLNATSVVSKPVVTVHAQVAKLTAEQTKLIHQEKAQATKLAAEHAKQAKQEKAAEAKFAKQEAALEAKLSRQATLAAKKATAGTPLAHQKVVKTGNALTGLLLLGPTNLPPPTDNSSPIAGQLSPAQLQLAYGVNLLGASNQGQGVTIGIVDEFDDPNIISDANVYSAAYGLPQFNVAGSGGPSMVVYKDNFNGTVTSGAGTGVGGETSLDVELAHAMAPMANILLVEVPGTGETTYNQVFAQLLHGVQYAAGASVSGSPVVSVSLSYGVGESSIGNSTAVKTQNTTYLASGAATNVAVTVSTGDSSSPQYPATSPNVIGVGGTSLFLASAQGDYGYETAWGGLAFPSTSNPYTAGAGGGGPSVDFSAPTFQSANNVKLSSFRTIPDVSMVGDPYTGVSIYDSFDSLGWSDTGGTSVSSPMFAGVLALAQQQRLAAHMPILTSVQINTALYTAYTNPTTYADLFNDVTLGKNTYLNGRTGKVSVTGYSATTGYDEATGLGSPWAANMIPYLVTGIDPAA
jgi:subtilase family serine protease